ncbi:YggS family pyridoxal phosphate-dependent enzyme [Buchnera aphidicola (Muscaphis stroyani)]|uniref:Pyridoxal phosphate homeostasis protein n=1 Tax=Buchnera aphidicola (Muscaphis stroyani) TaxID=1241869 RepID=A0A4D6Y594_9GAMM|nr:YggS family pyridoxal phosphate-dependent enzyme [Buchnera aphidicola]QCI24582.1 YggS family pyridoxal phosphate-dependent enzyme [Buchnera aphidicola (Muscaphis stroyani)]
MNNIKLNLKLLKKNIQTIIEKKNLLSSKIKIVAVSKNQSIEKIKKAILLGQNDFGESYIQESINKIKRLKTNKNINWHFIGKIQSNKVKKIAKYFSWCQTIDRERIAILLNRHRSQYLIPMNVLMQINISQESRKNGIDINEYHKLAKTISLMPYLNFRGIMAMPSIQKNNIHAEKEYKKIQSIFNVLKKTYDSIDTLSVGTSSDMENALIFKSNMLRIGRSIFK